MKDQAAQYDGLKGFLHADDVAFDEVFDVVVQDAFLSFILEPAEVDALHVMQEFVVNDADVAHVVIVKIGARRKITGVVKHVEEGVSVAFQIFINESVFDVDRDAFAF